MARRLLVINVQIKVSTPMDCSQKRGVPQDLRMILILKIAMIPLLLVTGSTALVLDRTHFETPTVTTTDLISDFANEGWVLGDGVDPHDTARTVSPQNFPAAPLFIQRPVQPFVCNI